MKGLSLIESVVYVAILAIVLVVTVNSAIVMARAYAEARVGRNVVEQGSTALRRIVREVRLAHAVDSDASSFDTNPGELVLETVVGPEDDTETTRRFYLENGALMMDEGTQTRTLTSGIQITRIVFRHIQNNDTSEAVRVELVLSDSLGHAQKEEDYSATAVLRRGY